MTDGGSILAADFGSVTTRVVLFDVVDGEYRLVARRETLTTRDAPHDDVSLGLRRLLRDMGSAMGRRLTDADGHLITPEGDDRSGVDTFVTTASVGRPMRAVMINMLRDASLQYALRAISGSYIEVVAVLTLQETPVLQDQLNLILLARPDLIVFAGGVDGGPHQAMLRLAEGLRLALQVSDRSIRPQVVYAGNAALADRIEGLLTDLTEVIVADNVMPAYGVTALDSAASAISQAYERYAERFGEGFETIVARSSGIIPTAQAYELMARYLSRERGGNVILADIGSVSALVIAVINDTLYTRMSPQHGLGHSAKSLLETVGAAAIRAWLPLNIRSSELDNIALNRSLRPSSLSDTLRDLYIDQAFLRASLRHLMQEAAALWDGSGDVLPPINTIVAAGAGLTRTGKPAYNLLLIADAIQPAGVTQVVADAYGVMSALGGLARVNAAAAVQLLESDSLDLLGTLISLEGVARLGRVAAKLIIRTGDETIRYDLQSGDVLFLPLPLGYTLDVDIRCQRGMRVMGRSQLRVTVQGGSAGVMFDGRGRPFSAGSTVQERARNLPRWIHAATDDALHAIPSDWLEAVMDDSSVEVIAPAPMSRADRRRLMAKQAAERDAEAFDDADLQSLLTDDPDASQRDGIKALRTPRPADTAATPFTDDDDDLRKLL